MSRGIARLGDRTQGVCSCHDSPINVGGKIITASIDSFSDNLGIARLGDLVLADCGHYGKIITASENYIVNNIGAARLGDKTDGCYKATIITASENTQID